MLTKFTPAPNTGNATDAASLMTRLADAGTAAPQTPATLVPFLAAALRDHSASAPAAEALMRVTLSPDHAAAEQAVAALLSPRQDATGQPQPRSLSQAWTTLTPDARVAFTAAAYRQQTGQDTPVAALAADDRASAWFIRELDAGHLPQPGDWLEPLGGESQALDLAGSDDDALAHAALAALAAAVGAGPTDQQRVIDRLGPTPRSADDLQVRWPPMQRELIVAQLQDAAGDHRLVLVITENTHLTNQGNASQDDRAAFEQAALTTNPQDPTADATTDTPIVPITPANITLGIVEITIDDTHLAMTGDPITLDVPNNFAALRIADPIQLRNFPTPDVADLPLEQVPGPLDLRKNPAGVWTATAPFGPAHTLEVRLEPTP